MPLPVYLTEDLVGMPFVFDGRALHVHVGNGEMVRASRACDLITGNVVTLTAGNQGVWIPYRAQIATYGLLGDFAWAASGPFSGCELAIGDVGGEVYVAHISIERHRYEARQAFANWVRHSPAPYYRSRIRASEMAGNYACYVFVSVEPQLQIVRMDVTTNTVGGTDGIIANIEHLDVTAQSPAPSAPSASAPRRSRSCRCIIM